MNARGRAIRVPAPDEGRTAAPHPSRSPDVVALVCSAGGLEALSRILPNLPDDFPAAVVVLQHMDPVRDSQLAEILARRCALPVRFAVDGDRLEGGAVLVVPPGRHALATVDGRLRLFASGAIPPARPSADLLLATLAVTAGSRAVAVVLSGSGHDGATGATAVHQLGGVVIAADQQSSADPSMPLAAIGRAEIVDHVVPVGEIPVLLDQLIRSSPD